MYCKHCGSEIEDNSKFCKSCGKNLNEDKSKENIEQKKEIEYHKDEKWPTGLKVFLAIIIIVTIIGAVIGIVLGHVPKNNASQNSTKNENRIENTDDNKLLSRNANLNDLNVVWHDHSLSYSGTVVPKTDIENLVLTFKFYDDNDNTVKTIEKRFGNITKNQQYDFTITMSEIGYTTALKISGVRYNVSSGQVKYFG